MRPRSTRLARAAVAAGLVAGLLAGCSSDQYDRPVATPDSKAVARSILDALNSDDRAGFAELFADDADAQRVDTLWGNLRQLELSSIVDQPDGSWQVGWQVPGEQGVATHLVAPKWWCDTQSCLLEDIDRHPGSPAPIWSIEAIGIRQAGSVTLIGGGDLDSWASAAEESAEFVREHPAAGLTRPAENQVIEVPADSSHFEQVMGVSVFDLVDTGALTWVADSGGPDRSGQPAPARIVINPAAAQETSGDARYLLLVHEQTHAATSWLGHPAAGRLWLSEGLAEQMMLQASEAASQRSDQLLTEACPLTTTPPADTDFADPDKADLAYAWSAAAVSELLAGPDAADRISAAWQTAGADIDLESAPARCP